MRYFAWSQLVCSLSRKSHAMNAVYDAAAFACYCHI